MFLITVYESSSSVFISFYRYVFRFLIKLFRSVHIFGQVIK